ncbi:glycine/D-amino acid oxidase-like deaminating enzyme [Catalinimonas alkaloidigena]|uniref:FAD-dependent oxidoreductase n=1 Tax=Catalinimonas alkaloidigena TaxID=1075417 RepID=UPI0024057488|nr:FAD-dependent oxidoreductase [Catalinimonas alkaloidigena]MDF9799644.1 glycine/D-amino acid oxidase-like deaminating enzyme [Catalinimonas alkaloidigena]
MSLQKDRRKWLKTSLSASVGASLSPSLLTKAKSVNANFGAKPTAIVAGGGAMGSWTAYFLHKNGYEVSLCDPWGAGNPRASSGGESRLIRYLYGENEVYFRMAMRAMKLWKQEEVQLGKKLLHQTGMLIFCEMPHYEYAEISRPFYEKEGFVLEKIPASELKKAYPFLNTEELNHAIYDPDAGYVLAKESCRALSNFIVQEGGKSVLSTATPTNFQNGKLQGVRLSDGSIKQADTYVFANGPWLKYSFPELLSEKLQITRQPVFFFGAPADFAQKLDKPFPVWMNRDTANQERSYGVYELSSGTFKFAYTQLEEQEINPSLDDRLVRDDEIAHARYLMEKRFAFMKDAPLIDAKVCQHSNTPDKNFILDHHPEANNLWILGGGSGHGFKHGPVIGELSSQSILQQKSIEPAFSLSRLPTLESFTSAHK